MTPNEATRKKQSRHSFFIDKCFNVTFIDEWRLHELRLLKYAKRLGSASKKSMIHTVYRGNQRIYCRVLKIPFEIKIFPEIGLPYKPAALQQFDGSKVVGVYIGFNRVQVQGFKATSRMRRSCLRPCTARIPPTRRPSRVPPSM